MDSLVECKKCLKMKTIDEFYPSNLRVGCKACKSLYMKVNKDLVNKHQRNSYRKMTRNKEQYSLYLEKKRTYYKLKVA